MDDSYENADYPIAGYNFIKLLNTNDPSMFICICFFTNLNVSVTTMLHGTSYFLFYFCMPKSLHTSSTVEED